MVNYGESIIIKKVKKMVNGRGMIHMVTILKYKKDDKFSKN